MSPAGQSHSAETSLVRPHTSGLTREARRWALMLPARATVIVLFITVVVDDEATFGFDLGFCTHQTYVRALKHACAHASAQKSTCCVAVKYGPASLSSGYSCWRIASTIGTNLLKLSC